MIKFMVVLSRRPGMSEKGFRRILEREHGAMAEALPGLRKYIQNHVAPDPSRAHPAWDAVVELFWDDRASMEAAWASPEGQLATAHLAEFADLERTSWSIVREDVRR